VQCRVQGAGLHCSVKGAVKGAVQGAEVQGAEQVEGCRVALQGEGCSAAAAASSSSKQQQQAAAASWFYPCV